MPRRLTLFLMLALTAAFAAGENSWTYGRLEALEEARADHAEQEFWDRWPEFRAQLKRATTR